MIGASLFSSLLFSGSEHEAPSAPPKHRPGVQILLSSLNRTGLYQDGSLSISRRLGSIASAQFELIDRTGVFSLSEGADVTILHNGIRLFAGTVNSVSENWPEDWDSSPALKVISVGCQSYDAIPTHRDCTLALERQDVTTALETIVDNILAADGITADIRVSGIEVGPLSFSATSCWDAISRVVKLAGATAWVDDDRVLRVQALGTPAPISLGDGNRGAFRRLSRRSTRADYRNVYRLKGGVDAGARRLHKFVANGTDTSWDVPSAIATVPTIRIESVPELSIGIRGLNSEDDPNGFRFFWRKGETAISQRSTDDPLPAETLIEIEYQPLLEIVAISRDSQEISARAALEGGTGLYEAAGSESGVDSAELARDLADAELRKNARTRTELRITLALNSFGWECGQVLPVSLTREGIDDEYLVTAYLVSDPGNGEFLDCSVVVIDTEYDGGWTELFRRLAQSAADFAADRTSLVYPAAQVDSAVVIGDVVSASEGDNLDDFDDDPYSWFRVDDNAACGMEFVQDGIIYVRGGGVEDLP